MSDDDEPLIPAKQDATAEEQEKKDDENKSEQVQPESAEKDADKPDEEKDKDAEMKDAPEEEAESSGKRQRGKKEKAQKPEEGKKKSKTEDSEKEDKNSSKQEEKKPESKESKKVEKKSKAAPKKEESEKESAEEKEEEEEEEDTASKGTYWNVDPTKKRERKSLEAFHPDVGKQEIVIEEGPGKKIKDIPAVFNLIQDHVISKSNKSDPLKNLSKFLFNRIPPPKELKENLGEYNGKNFKDEKQEDAFHQRLKKRSVAELKGMLSCLGLDHRGKQVELAGRLFEFLKKPGKEGVKAKAKSTPAKKTKSPSAGSKRKTPSKNKTQDDDEDEDEEEDETEDEEEEEKEKSPPKKKSKTSKKESKQSDDEDDDADKPLKAGGESDVKATLKKHIYAICKDADLSTLTLRMVRDQLEKEHKIDVKAYKEDIKNMVDAYVKEQEDKNQ